VTTPIAPLNEASPRAMARATGALFLVTIVCGIIAETAISQRLIVLGDPATTASNILANESTYRLGFAIYLVEMASQIAMTVVYYFLLKPVSRPLALLMAVFSLTGCIIKTFSRVFYFAPLLLVGGPSWLSSFTVEQQHGLVALLLRLNDQGPVIALVFFGLAGLVEGWLVIESTFLPRLLGVVSLLGGIGWLTFLWPPLGFRLFAIVAGIGLLGSMASILWLLIKGVNEDRWRELAAASAASIWR
jgi:hypothetical protein